LFLVCRCTKSRDRIESEEWLVSLSISLYHRYPPRWDSKCYLLEGEDRRCEGVARVCPLLRIPVVETLLVPKGHNIVFA
jgi:hypothetical protein